MMAEEPQPVASTTARPEGRTRLLLVEDEPDYAYVLQQALADGGEQFQIHHVQRLDEALQYVRENGVDIVVLDLLLPDSQGIGTVTSIHAAAPNLPLVVLTGMDNRALAAQAVQEGAQDYLVKGRIDANLLRYSLHRALDRKQRDRALQADEERFQQVVMGVADYAVFLLDPAGRVVTWNVGAERLMA